MPTSAIWFFWIALHLLIGFFGTIVARRYALRRQLIDEPGERRSHAVSTPRGGGISIAIAVLVELLCLALWSPSRASIFWAGMAGLILVASIGWIDDHRPLSVSARLLTHIAAAGILAATFYSVTQQVPHAVLVFVLVIGLVNVWNFMDGIDGLATSQAVIVAIGYGFTAGYTSTTQGLSFAFAAAACGFLVHNFPRAKIFLGDVGSGTLGFTLALILSLMLLDTPEPSSQIQLTLLLPPCAFMVDATLTLGRRIVRKEKWWTAHVEHSYQVWAGRRGHSVVTLFYALWTSLSVLLMWWLQFEPLNLMLATASIWYFLAAIIWVLLQRMYQVPARGIASEV